jgi:hypothetical protein
MQIYPDAWRRFTDADEPRPGKQWRWEKSKTGRFFIYVPHWFLIGLALVLASAPWLPWRFRLRTLLIAMAALAVMLGLLIWTNATPPKSQEQFDAIFTDLKNAAAKEVRNLRVNQPSDPEFAVAVVERFFARRGCSGFAA